MGASECWISPSSFLSWSCSKAPLRSCSPICLSRPGRFTRRADRQIVWESIVRTRPPWNNDAVMPEGSTALSPRFPTREIVSKFAHDAVQDALSKQPFGHLDIPHAYLCYPPPTTCSSRNAGKSRVGPRLPPRKRRKTVGMIAIFGASTTGWATAVVAAAGTETGTVSGEPRCVARCVMLLPPPPCCAPPPFSGPTSGTWKPRPNDLDSTCCARPRGFVKVSAVAWRVCSRGPPAIWRGARSICTVVTRGREHKRTQRANGVDRPKNPSEPVPLFASPAAESIVANKKSRGTVWRLETASRWCKGRGAAGAWRRRRRRERELGKTRRGTASCADDADAARPQTRARRDFQSLRRTKDVK